MWMDERMNGHERLDGQMNVWTDGWMDKRIAGLAIVWMDEQM